MYNSLKNKEVKYPKNKKQIENFIKSPNKRTIIEIAILIVRLALKKQITFNHFFDITLF